MPFVPGTIDGSCRVFGPGEVSAAHGREVRTTEGTGVTALDMLIEAVLDAPDDAPLDVSLLRLLGGRHAPTPDVGRRAAASVAVPSPERLFCPTCLHSVDLDGYCDGCGYQVIDRLAPQTLGSVRGASQKENNR